MIRKCSVCNCELADDEHGMCDDCKLSILFTTDIPPNIEDMY